MLSLKASSPTALTMLDLLNPEEVFGYANRPSQAAIFGKAALEKGISRIMECDVSRSRPYIGEKCYSLFFAYRAVLGRTVYLLMDDLEKGGEFRVWHQEKRIRELFTLLLDENEMTEFDRLRVGHVARFTDYVETRMLSYLREVISGRDTSDEGLEQALKISQLVASWTIESQSSPPIVGFSGSDHAATGG